MNYYSKNKIEELTKSKQKRTRMIGLSITDAKVPITHVPLDDFLLSSEYCKNVLGRNTLIAFRKKTFDNIKREMHFFYTADVSKFWNDHILGINECELNCFYQYEILKPFCYYIDVFKVAEKDCIDWYEFGVNKASLQEYKLAYEKSVKDGIKFIPPKRNSFTLLDKEEERKSKVVEFSDAKIHDTDVVEIPKNELYVQLMHYVHLVREEKATVVQDILKTFLEEHPVDGLLELSEYSNNSDILKVYETSLEKGDFEEITTNIASPILSKVRQIITNWNNDIENISNQISLSDFIESALDLYVSKVDLKYKDPKLHKQYMEMQARIIAQEMAEQDK